MPRIIIDRIIEDAAEIVGSKQKLADQLGVSERAVYHWIQQRNPTPPGVYRDLRGILERRRAEIDALIARLPADQER